MKLIYEDSIMHSEYPCTKAEKGSTYIQLYNGENKTELFAGISDFSGYSCEGGEWSTPTPTETDVLEAQVTYTALMTDTLLEG